MIGNALELTGDELCDLDPHVQTLFLHLPLPVLLPLYLLLEHQRRPWVALRHLQDRVLRCLLWSCHPPLRAYRGQRRGARWWGHSAA